MRRRHENRVRKFPTTRRARSTSCRQGRCSIRSVAVDNARKRSAENGSKPRTESPGLLRYRSRQAVSFLQKVVTASPARAALLFDYNQKDSTENGDGSDHVT